MHFCVFAYVYEENGGLGRSESQKCNFSHFLHFGAPESAKSDFFIRVRRFLSFWEPQIHFFHFWAVPGCPGRHDFQVSWRTDTRTPRSRDGLPYGRPGSRHGPRPPLGVGPAQIISRVRVCKHPPPLQYGWLLGGGGLV